VGRELVPEVVGQFHRFSNHQREWARAARERALIP
jgi:hypothetical protein